MEVEFGEIELENYSSFIGKHTFDLAVGGVTRVHGRNELEPNLGPNDAGKSTLLNAIPWCLYGRTTGDLATTDIRPWKGKGQTKVTVHLITWDGDKGLRHTVTRTAGPNSLLLNGKPCAQEDVERLVGWSLGTFRQAVFLGQGIPLFHDLPNREKLELLVDVLGLDRWDGYAEKAANRTCSLDDRAQGLVLEIGALNARAEELATQVKRQQAAVDEWEGQRQGLLKEARAKAKRLGKEVAALEKLLNDTALALDSTETELKLNEADATKLLAKVADAEVTHRVAKANQRTAQEQHAQTTAELAALRKDRRCPTCGTVLEQETNFAANKARLEKALANYSELANGSAVAAALKALEKAQAKEREWRTKHIAPLSAKVHNLTQDERMHRRNLETQQALLRADKAKVVELEDGGNPHRERLGELRRAQAKAISDSTGAQEELAQVQAAAERARYWVKGFKDVRLFVLEDVLRELEFTMNDMLDTLGLVGWEARYDVERETKSGTIQRGLITTVLSPHKHEDVKWKAWGGGVGQRLRLAGALALSQVLLTRVGVGCSLEVLDEPTAHLSPEGVEDLCDMLGERARALGKHIILVDHKVISGARFTRNVTVVKDKAGSRIEER